MGGISKHLTKVHHILNKKKKGCRQKDLTLDCSSSSSTQDLLSQLEQAQHDQITHLTLSDSLQRPDNVRIFSALGSFVTNDRCKLRQIWLEEPRVRADDYRRWCFKKTNFLRHVYQDCKEREIKVKIQGTLILETPEGKAQDVSSWLTTHIPNIIPLDRDITSLSISMRDVLSTTATGDESNQCTTRTNALSGLRRSRSDVERVFQALIDVFNNNDRPWDFVSCRVLYNTISKYAAPQTESLVEVAQIYDIPLQVQWESMDESKKETGTWTKSTRQAQEMMNDLLSPPTKTKVLPSNPPRMSKVGKSRSGEDATASVTDCEGSSGQFLSY